MRRMGSDIRGGGRWRGRLLIVEDDPTVLEFMGLVLEDDFEPFCAENGKQAVELAEKYEPHVAVIDKNLPDTNGLELLARLRKTLPDLEAILVTGYVTTSSALQAIRLRVRSYLPKPFEVGDLVSAVEDAMEVCRLRDQLRTSQARRIHAERVDTIGMLASGVIHEISNPLMMILSNLQFADEQLKEMAEAAGSPEEKAQIDKTRRFFTDAQFGANRLEELVRDLRTFGRKDGKRVDLQLSEVVGGAVRMARSYVALTAKLETDLQSHSKVRGVPAQLSQVLLNLLINASHALDPASRRTNKIIARTYDRPADGEVVLEVEDNGHGIPADVIDHIFDRFFTTKSDTQGTGLGLAICQEIVLAHGGEITAESTPGKKTVFRMRLPVGDRKSVEPTPPKSKGPPRQAVLVVDDEAAVVRGLKGMLDRDYEVLTALDGESAAKIVRSHPVGAIRAVVCDIHMTPLDGFQTLDRLNAVEDTIGKRFLFLTGNPTMEEEARARGHSVLQKPLDPSVLRREVAELVGRGS